MHVVGLFQFATPSGIFMDFVDVEVRTTLFDKFIHQIHQSVIGKIEVVCCHIQVMAILALFDTLQNHGRFADPSGTDNTEETSIPVDLIIFVSLESYWCPFQ